MFADLQGMVAASVDYSATLEQAVEVNMPGWSAPDLLGEISRGAKPDGYCGIMFDGDTGS